MVPVGDLCPCGMAFGGKGRYHRRSTFVSHISSPLTPGGEALVVIPCCNMPMAVQDTLGLEVFKPACCLLGALPHAHKVGLDLAKNKFNLMLHEGRGDTVKAAVFVH